jgi:hypothetical protein
MSRQQQQQQQYLRPMASSASASSKNAYFHDYMMQHLLVPAPSKDSRTGQDPPGVEGDSIMTRIQRQQQPWPVEQQRLQKDDHGDEEEDDDELRKLRVQQRQQELLARQQSELLRIQKRQEDLLDRQRNYQAQNEEQAPQQHPPPPPPAHQTPAHPYYFGQHPTPVAPPYYAPGYPQQQQQQLLPPTHPYQHHIQQPTPEQQFPTPPDCRQHQTALSSSSSPEENLPTRKQPKPGQTLSASTLSSRPKKSSDSRPDKVEAKKHTSSSSMTIEEEAMAQKGAPLTHSKNEQQLTENETRSQDDKLLQVFAAPNQAKAAAISDFSIDTGSIGGEAETESWSGGSSVAVSIEPEPPKPVPRPEPPKTPQQMAAIAAEKRAQNDKVLKTMASKPTSSKPELARELSIDDGSDFEEEEGDSAAASLSAIEGDEPSSASQQKQKVSIPPPPLMTPLPTSYPASSGSPDAGAAPEQFSHLLPAASVAKDAAKASNHLEGTPDDPALQQFSHLLSSAAPKKKVLQDDGPPEKPTSPTDLPAAPPFMTPLPNSQSKNIETRHDSGTGVALEQSGHLSSGKAAEKISETDPPVRQPSDAAVLQLSHLLSSAAPEKDPSHDAPLRQAKATSKDDLLPPPPLTTPLPSSLPKIVETRPTGIDGSFGPLSPLLSTPGPNRTPKADLSANQDQPDAAAFQQFAHLLTSAAPKKDDAPEEQAETTKHAEVTSPHKPCGNDYLPPPPPLTTPLPSSLPRIIETRQASNNGAAFDQFCHPLASPARAPKKDSKDGVPVDDVAPIQRFSPLSGTATPKDMPQEHQNKSTPSSGKRASEDRLLQAIAAPTKKPSTKRDDDFSIDSGSCADVPSYDGSFTEENNSEIRDDVDVLKTPDSAAGLAMDKPPVRKVVPKPKLQLDPEEKKARDDHVLRVIAAPASSHHAAQKRAVDYGMEDDSDFDVGSFAGFSDEEGDSAGEDQMDDHFSMESTIATLESDKEYYYNKGPQSHTTSRTEATSLTSSRRPDPVSFETSKVKPSFLVQQQPGAPPIVPLPVLPSTMPLRLESIGPLPDKSVTIESAIGGPESEPKPSCADEAALNQIPQLLPAGKTENAAMEQFSHLVSATKPKDNSSADLPTKQAEPPALKQSSEDRLLQAIAAPAKKAVRNSDDNFSIDSGSCGDVQSFAGSLSVNVEETTRIAADNVGKMHEMIAVPVPASNPTTKPQTVRKPPPKPELQLNPKEKKARDENVLRAIAAPAAPEPIEKSGIGYSVDDDSDFDVGSFDGSLSTDGGEECANIDNDIAMETLSMPSTIATNEKYYLSQVGSPSQAARAEAMQQPMAMVTELAPALLNSPNAARMASGSHEAASNQLSHPLPAPATMEGSETNIVSRPEEADSQQSSHLRPAAVASKHPETDVSPKEVQPLSDKRINDDRLLQAIAAPTKKASAKVDDDFSIDSGSCGDVASYEGSFSEGNDAAPEEEPAMDVLKSSVPAAVAAKPLEKKVPPKPKVQLSSEEKKTHDDNVLRAIAAPATSKTTQKQETVYNMDDDSDFDVGSYDGSSSSSSGGADDEVDAKKFGGMGTVEADVDKQAGLSSPPTKAEPMSDQRVNDDRLLQAIAAPTKKASAKVDDDFSIDSGSCGDVASYEGSFSEDNDAAPEEEPAMDVLKSPAPAAIAAKPPEKKIPPKPKVQLSSEEKKTHDDNVLRAIAAPATSKTTQKQETVYNMDDDSDFDVGSYDGSLSSSSGGADDKEGAKEFGGMGTVEADVDKQAGLSSPPTKAEPMSDKGINDDRLLQAIAAPTKKASAKVDDFSIDSGSCGDVASYEGSFSEDNDAAPEEPAMDVLKSPAPAAIAAKPPEKVPPKPKVQLSSEEKKTHDDNVLRAIAAPATSKTMQKQETVYNMDDDSDFDVGSYDGSLSSSSGGADDEVDAKKFGGMGTVEADVDKQAGLSSPPTKAEPMSDQRVNDDRLLQAIAAPTKKASAKVDDDFSIDSGSCGDVASYEGSFSEDNDAAPEEEPAMDVLKSPAPAAIAAKPLEKKVPPKPKVQLSSEEKKTHDDNVLRAIAAPATSKTTQKQETVYNMDDDSDFDVGSYDGSLSSSSGGADDKEGAKKFGGMGTVEADVDKQAGLSSPPTKAEPMSDQRVNDDRLLQAIAAPTKKASAKVDDDFSIDSGSCGDVASYEGSFSEDNDAAPEEEPAMDVLKSRAPAAIAAKPPEKKIPPKPKVQLSSEEKKTHDDNVLRAIAAPATSKTTQKEETVYNMDDDSDFDVGSYDGSLSSSSGVGVGEDDESYGNDEEVAEGQVPPVLQSDDKNTVATVERHEPPSTAEVQNHSSWGWSINPFSGEQWSPENVAKSNAEAKNVPTLIAHGYGLKPDGAENLLTSTEVKEHPSWDIWAAINPFSSSREASQEADSAPCHKHSVREGTLSDEDEDEDEDWLGTGGARDHHSPSSHGMPPPPPMPLSKANLNITTLGGPLLKTPAPVKAQGPGSIHSAEDDAHVTSIAGSLHPVPAESSAFSAVPASSSTEDDQNVAENCWEPSSPNNPTMNPEADWWDEPNAISADICKGEDDKALDDGSAQSEKSHSPMTTSEFDPPKSPFPPSSERASTKSNLRASTAHDAPTQHPADDMDPTEQLTILSTQLDLKKKPVPPPSPDQDSTSAKDPSISGGFDASVSEGFDASVSEGLDPSVSEGFDPSASEGIDTSGSEGIDASASEGIDASASEGIDASASEGIDPSLSEDASPRSSPTSSRKKTVVSATGEPLLFATHLRLKKKIPHPPSPDQYDSPSEPSERDAYASEGDSPPPAPKSRLNLQIKKLDGSASKSEPLKTKAQTAGSRDGPLPAQGSGVSGGVKEQKLFSTQLNLKKKTAIASRPPDLNKSGGDVDVDDIDDNSYGSDLDSSDSDDLPPPSPAKKPRLNLSMTRIGRAPAAAENSPDEKPVPRLNLTMTRIGALPVAEASPEENPTQKAEYFGGSLMANKSPQKKSALRRMISGKHGGSDAGSTVSGDERSIDTSVTDALFAQGIMKEAGKAFIPDSKNVSEGFEDYESAYEALGE